MNSEKFRVERTVEDDKIPQRGDEGPLEIRNIPQSEGGYGLWGVFVSYKIRDPLRVLPLLTLCYQFSVLVGSAGWKLPT